MANEPSPTTLSSSTTLELPTTSRPRRSALCLLITVGTWSLFFLWQERDSLARLTSLQLSQQQVQTTRNYIRNTTPLASKNETIHILFGLKGKETAFLSEFQVALKNVLLQAPLDQPMHIHIMADDEAYQAIVGGKESAASEKDPLYIFLPSLHQQWHSIQPIQVRIYNVQQLLEETWTPFLMHKFQSYSFQSMTGHHTVGAFFRLLAHQVLLRHDPTIEYVIYLDPDVIFLANDQAVWNERPVDDHTNDILFAWGASMCSGFLLLHVPRLEQLWNLTDTLDLESVALQYKQAPNDKLFLRAINVTYPAKVALLSPAWDINIADGIWRLSKTIVEERPQIGMMHFNGGPHDSEEPYYKVHSFLTQPALVETWGVALYYARMPWTWAQYLAESQIPTGSLSYPLEVYFYPS